MPSRGTKTWVAIFVALVASSCVSMNAIACSIGTGVPEVDLTNALRSSDEVFVARLGEYRKVMPPAGEHQMFVESKYELIEAIKGSPAQTGVLTERNPYLPLPGQPPGPACGPWLIFPTSNGTTALVFASHVKKDKTEYLWAGPFSTQLNPDQKSSEEVVNIVRSIQQERKAP